jgi:hypothetical protein
VGNISSDTSTDGSDVETVVEIAPTTSTAPTSPTAPIAPLFPGHVPWVTLVGSPPTTLPPIVAEAYEACVEAAEAYLRFSH